MTDEPQLPPENLVEQAVERAGEKLAQAAGPIATGGPVLKRWESLAVVAVLVILNLANIVLSYQARTATQGNAQDHNELCLLMAEAIPTDSQDATAKLAECLK